MLVPLGLELSLGFLQALLDTASPSHVCSFAGRIIHFGGFDVFVGYSGTLFQPLRPWIALSIILVEAFGFLGLWFWLFLQFP